jgi:hypothetical protein
MGRTPQAIVADVVEALGQHRLEQAADARVGEQGHGAPALVLGVLVTKAHLAFRTREETVVGQGAAVDLPAQVVQDWRSTLPRRLARSHPSCSPDRCWQRQVGAFLAHQSAKQSAKPRSNRGSTAESLLH